MSHHVSRRAIGLTVWIGLFFALFVVVSHAAWAQPAAPVTDAQKEDARSHFELGLSHFDREEWPAALVEFLKSRQLFPTRGNTKDAAICLRKVGRFDESLDMYEALLREFTDLTPDDRTLAASEIANLQASVGTVAFDGAPPGAAILIDGAPRGKAPMKPIRLSAGTHTLRVLQDGSLPFESRIDLAGRQAAIVHVTLATLTQAGRLEIKEHGQRALTVYVDGAAVGRTPWDGAVAPGSHTVWLSDDSDVGTQPVTVDVTVGQVAAMDLVAEKLSAILRVDLTPPTAAILIDGVSVGHGSWEGHLRAGTHRIGGALEGYAPFSQDLTLVENARSTVANSLESDTGRNGVELEVTLGAPIGVLTGGDLQSGCKSPCSSSIPFGFEGILHATYQFKVGLGVGLHAGYLLLSHGIHGRPTTASSQGNRVSTGSLDDSLLLGGLVGGVDGRYRTSGVWPFTLRIGFGAFVGPLRDRRSGSLTDSKGGKYQVSVVESPTAAYLDIAPEVRFGRKLGDHFEISVGVEGHFLPALSKPKWDSSKPISTGADGEGTFKADELTGSVLIAVVPGLGLQYEF